MGHQINYKPSQSILIGTFTEPFNIAEDAIAVGNALGEALEEVEGFVYYVADLSQVRVSFEDLGKGMGAAYGDPNSAYRSARLKIFTVSVDLSIEVGTRATNQDQFGDSSAIVFRTVDDAMAAIRKTKEEDGV